MADQPDSQQENQKPAKGYGKRPVWQWVVIYLIIGAIVYGLIYYFAQNGGYGGDNGDNTKSGSSIYD